jgi:sugar lactone lactonase YvrE
MLGAALAAAGCRVPVTSKAVTPRPLASAAVAQLPAVAALAGKVKLIATTAGALGAGLVSNNGSGIISDHASGIISDHAAGVISNNSGAIVANHAAGYRALAADALATFALADADVTFTDAAGKPLVGPNGKPLVARTDASGAYALPDGLPPGNAVAHVKLFNGGELAGLVVPSGKGPEVLDLDLASTLGARYVLDRFVKGDQAVLAKLPRAEADRLRQQLDVVRQDLAAAPSYAPAQLLAATEALRTKEPAVNQAIEDVRALLLGQSKLGAGLAGSVVPLAGPTGLAWDPAGGLLIGEAFIGRVRELAPDGTIQTLADAGSGKIASNFLRLADLVRAADGTLYAASTTTGLYRATPDGKVVRLLATAAEAAGRDLQPQALALAADGTLYVGEFTWQGASSGPRVLAVAPDGQARALAIATGWEGGKVSALAVAADGALLVVYTKGSSATIYRYADGKATAVATLADGGVADMALAPDGKLYLARPDLHRVDVLAPGGQPTPVAIEGLLDPESMAMGPDGTLYVADAASNAVLALAPDGTSKRVAGTDASADVGDAASVGLDQPAGVAFDADGALYITETGNSTIRRFKDGKLAPFAGGGTGDEVDGVPALGAALGVPVGIVGQDHTLTFVENTGARIRRIGPDGLLGSLLQGPAKLKLEPGKDYPGPLGIPTMWSVALDAAGRCYVTGGTHQVLRYTPGDGGGTVRVLAGTHRTDNPDDFKPATFLGRDEAEPIVPLGMPLGVAVAPDGAPCFVEFTTSRVVKVLDADGPAPKLQRLAGLAFADMLASAGSGQLGVGEGTPAEQTALIFPTAIAFDQAGNLYVAEAGTIHLGALTSVPGAGALGGGGVGALGLPKLAGRVRKVASDGKITTVAGRGTRFFPDDGGDNALILPTGLAIAPDGRLAIADLGANAVKILPAGSY